MPSHSIRFRAGISAFALALSAFAPALPAHALSPVYPGRLIKGESFSAIYYLSNNGKRYVFPDEKAFKSWYLDFSTVETISDQQLGAIMIGGNVTYRPGLKMVKVESSPNVYVVEKGGVLRWINSEAVATGLYGANWNRNVNDIPDVAFANYTIGPDVNAASEYNPAGQLAAVTTIDMDKGVTASIVATAPPAALPSAPAPLPSAPVSTRDPNDNSDASNPELDVTRPENQSQAAYNRIADDPRTWSAYYSDPGPASPISGVEGMMRGCAGTFVQTSSPQRGTLIKGSASYVYYYASNGKRYIFPSAVELQSWYGATSPNGAVHGMSDTRACRGVVQVPDSVLAAMQIGGNVTVKPATFLLTSDSINGPRPMYLVDRNQTRRMVISDTTANLQELKSLMYPVPNSGGEIHGIPDTLLIQDYRVGPSFTAGTPLPTGPFNIETELGIL